MNSLHSHTSKCGLKHQSVTYKTPGQKWYSHRLHFARYILISIKTNRYIYRKKENKVWTCGWAVI